MEVPTVLYNINTHQLVSSSLQLTCTLGQDPFLGGGGGGILIPPGGWGREKTLGTRMGWGWGIHRSPLTLLRAYEFDFR